MEVLIEDLSDKYTNAELTKLMKLIRKEIKQRKISVDSYINRACADMDPDMTEHLRLTELVLRKVITLDEAKPKLQEFMDKLERSGVRNYGISLFFNELRRIGMITLDELRSKLMPLDEEK
jgi:uncharacterized protein YqeY